MSDKTKMTKHLSGRYFTLDEFYGYLCEYPPCDYMGNVVCVPKWIYERVNDLTGGVLNDFSRDLFEAHVHCADPLIF